MKVMFAPKKYRDELREWETRMAIETRQGPEASQYAIKRVTDQLGVHPEALRTCPERASRSKLVRNNGPWRGIDDLEVAVVEYIDRYRPVQPAPASR
jgi:hypothetical protein